MVSADRDEIRAAVAARYAGLARANARAAGAENVEFLRGQIEAMPLPGGSVDVIISNCVINLSTNRPAVFAESFRVLRPGGRLGISDILAEDRLTAAERLERGTQAGCIAGAPSLAEYRGGLARAGFTSITITPAQQAGDGVHSAIIRAIIRARNKARHSGPETSPAAEST